MLSGTGSGVDIRTDFLPPAFCPSSESFSNIKSVHLTSLSTATKICVPLRAIKREGVVVLEESRIGAGVDLCGGAEKTLNPGDGLESQPGV
jgi:hypothetical protein